MSYIDLLEIYVSDTFCGYNLSERAKVILIKLTLSEFERPKHERKRPEEMVRLARHISKDHGNKSIQVQQR